MQVAIGLKAHSGWAASVSIGAAHQGFEIVDRRRIELVPDGEAWAKQPYHAAEGLYAKEAAAIVQAAIKSARAVALRSIKQLVNHLRSYGYDLAGCGVLMPKPMPDWSVDQILSVHFRMHKAEGVLFPDVLCEAAEKCGLACVSVAEKSLGEIAERAIGRHYDELLAKLGKAAGPPWAKDQRNAALVAMIALKQIQSR